MSKGVSHALGLGVADGLRDEAPEFAPQRVLRDLRTNNKNNTNNNTTSNININSRSRRSRRRRSSSSSNIIFFMWGRGC